MFFRRQMAPRFAWGCVYQITHLPLASYANVVYGYLTVSLLLHTVFVICLTVLVEKNVLLMAKTLMRNWKINEKKWPLRLMPRRGYLLCVLLQLFINRLLACFWHWLSKKPFTNLMKGELLHSANSAERWQSSALHFILLIHLKLLRRVNATQTFED